MIDFKSMVAQDVSRVFINPNEFAERHQINDDVVDCVVDKLLTNEAGDTLTNPLEGIYVNAVTIYVNSEDIRKPVEGEVLMLDGRMHLVNRVSDEMGILMIVAEANEQ